MPQRIRMNNEKRDLLWHIANRLIQETPVPSTSVEKAYKNFVKAHDAAFAAIKKAVEKWFPDAARKTFDRYGLLNVVRGGCVFLMHTDKNSHSSMHEFRLMHNIFTEHYDFVHALNVAGSSRRTHFDESEANKRNVFLGDIRDHYALPVISEREQSGWRYTQFVIDEAVVNLINGVASLASDYKTEVHVFREALKPTLDAVRSVIYSARYFDEIVEYWPEAKNHTHVVVDKPSTALTVVSDAARKLIEENMKARHVKLADADKEGEGR